MYYIIDINSIISFLATISITIEARNDTPVAYALTLETPEDTSLNIDLSATDVDHDIFSYSDFSFIITSIDICGTLQDPLKPSIDISSTPYTLLGHSVVYNPLENFNGDTEIFSYKVRDVSNVESTSVNVNIIVEPRNDKPIAYALSVQTPEDISLTIDLSATDVDHDIFSYSDFSFIITSIDI